MHYANYMKELIRSEVYFPVLRVVFIRVGHMNAAVNWGKSVSCFVPVRIEVFDIITNIMTSNTAYIM